MVPTPSVRNIFRPKHGHGHFRNALTLCPHKTITPTTKMLRQYALILACAPIICMGQREANTWYFGSDGAGLHFDGECRLTVLTDGPINGYEGCATVSDASSGEYLFCTNSANVWDRNGQLMDNSSLVPNGNTITQVTIVQKPGTDDLYYIFTSEVQAFSGQGYRFHAVDMSLNDGAGGIAFTDSVLYPAPVTEKITAIRHANGTDVWILGHAYGSDAYLAFLVTSQGVSTTPVISNIGKVHSDLGASSYDAIGELKASPDGSKVVAVTLYHPDIEIFSFNNATGTLSDPITIPEAGAFDGVGNASGLYGASFSESANMLYVGQWFSASADDARLLQYDLSSNDIPTITNSRVAFPTAGNPYSLKLAPDGKIYVAHAGMNTHLGVIAFPDSAGQACQYADDGLSLQGRHAGWGLNNLMEQVSSCDVSASIGAADERSWGSVQPNPFNDHLDLILDSDTPADLSLFDLSGRRIFEGRVQHRSTVHLGALSDGVYLYRIQLPSGRLVIGKVQKAQGIVR